MYWNDWKKINHRRLNIAQTPRSNYISDPSQYTVDLEAWQKNIIHKVIYKHTLVPFHMI